VKGFCDNLSLVFQRNEATGLDVSDHFNFAGQEECRLN